MENQTIEKGMRTIPEAFPPSEEKQALPNGPMDLDILSIEAESMRAHGIPQNLIPLLYQFGPDTGHPIPGGGAA